GGSGRTVAVRPRHRAAGGEAAPRDRGLSRRRSRARARDRRGEPARRADPLRRDLPAALPGRRGDGRDRAGADARRRRRRAAADGRRRRSARELRAMSGEEEAPANGREVYLEKLSSQLQGLRERVQQEGLARHSVVNEMLGALTQTVDVLSASLEEL